MPAETGLPLCHEYICHGGSCQEHRGIMFLMAMQYGSILPEWWLSKSGQVAHSELEYSAGRGSYKEMPKQEVVRIDFLPIAATTGEPELPDFHSELQPVIWSPSIELTLGQANNGITNGADPELLAQTIRILKEFSC